jgi:phage terminase large subunit
VREALPEYLLDDVSDRLRQMVEIGRPQPFQYQAHFLPHDVKVREWGAGAKTRVQTLMELNVRDIAPGAAQGPAERINAVRELLPNMRFNTGDLTVAAKTKAQKRVRVGLNRLRRYSRQFNDALNTYTTVAKHDSNSHGADALGEYAVNARIYVPTPPPPKPKEVPFGHTLLPPPPDHSTGRRIKL